MYEASGVEIEGTEDALRQFSRDIEGCDGTCQISLPNLTGTDKRGLSYAKAITVLLNDGLVNISASNGTIVISGSKEKLDILVNNILSLADSRQESPNNNSNHIHVEYVRDDFPFVAATALPLIVTKQQEA
jgi:hypothetical protein